MPLCDYPLRGLPQWPELCVLLAFWSVAYRQTGEDLDFAHLFPAGLWARFRVVIVTYEMFGLQWGLGSWGLEYCVQLGKEHDTEMFILPCCLCTRCVWKMSTSSAFTMLQDRDHCMSYH